eukprot:484568-Prymnesium_polylepis.1
MGSMTHAVAAELRLTASPSGAFACHRTLDRHVVRNADSATPVKTAATPPVNRASSHLSSIFGRKLRAAAAEATERATRLCRGSVSPSSPHPKQAAHSGLSDIRTIACAALLSHSAAARPTVMAILSTPATAKWRLVALSAEVKPLRKPNRKKVKLNAADAKLCHATGGDAQKTSRRGRYRAKGEATSHTWRAWGGRVTQHRFLGMLGYAPKRHGSLSSVRLAPACSASRSSKASGLAAMTPKTASESARVRALLQQPRWQSTATLPACEGSDPAAMLELGASVPARRPVC